MSNSTTKAARQGRSPAYPFISLRKALERAEQLRKAEGKHAVPLSSVYRAWGLGEKGSVGRQTLAALRYFGLVTYEGRGAERRTRLSDRALRILLDRQPDSPERDQLIRGAALYPLIYASLWTEWEADLPSDATIETYLIRDCGFSESAAPDLIASYKDTIEFAKLAEPDNMPSDNESDEGEENEEQEPPSPDFDAWRRKQQKVPLMEGERVVFIEENEPNQYVKLVASGDVDEALLDALNTYVERQRKRLGVGGSAPVRLVIETPGVEDEE